MTMTTSPLLRWAILAAVLLAPRSASAHFLWITVEPAAESAPATVREFLAEAPEPEGSAFLKHVRGVKLTVDGEPIATTVGDEAIEARWAGPLPPTIDATHDLGVSSRGGTTYRLAYTARAQLAPIAADVKPQGDKLRVRLIKKDGGPAVEVLFDGRPVAKARIKVYPRDGEPKELTADDQGLATIPGLAEGKASLWANWVDKTAGEVDGKAYTETRHYATLTFRPLLPEVTASSDRATDSSPLPTAFSQMPEPAVNSFGGAVLGDWLYVYSGHVGRTHRYSVETTSKHFRRLSLKDRTTWEDLPMEKDLQGAALVSDGGAVYRIGGMSARNQPGSPNDLHSVADFGRFDLDKKAWTDLAPMPTPRSTHDAAVIGRTIYVVGGWAMDGESEGSAFAEDALAFDLDKPEAGWRSIEQPFRRRALSVAEAGGKLYVLGGLAEGGKVERRVDVYDPSTRAWSRGPDLPGHAKVDGFGTSAFGVDGRVYASGHSGRIYRLTALGDAWEVVGAWALPRITHRLLPGPGNHLLAVGGNAKGKPTPVIEAVPIPTVRPLTTAGGD